MGPGSDKSWLGLIEDLLDGAPHDRQTARDKVWMQVFAHVERSVRRNIGPLGDDIEVRRDIAVRVLRKLEANDHKNLRAWVAHRHRGSNRVSW